MAEFCGWKLSKCIFRNSYCGLGDTALRQAEEEIVSGFSVGQGQDAVFRTREIISENQELDIQRVGFIKK